MDALEGRIVTQDTIFIAYRPNKKLVVVVVVVITALTNRMFSRFTKES